LKESFEALKLEVSSALAPALTDAAKALDGVLGKVLDYLKTEDGQAMLKSLGDSVSSLFDDLGEIDPESVVESFTSVFNGLINGLKWIVDNQGTLVAALEAVVAGWAALKITGGALEVLKIVNGLKDLTSGTVVAQAASGLGNILKGAASIALKAAPWLAGLYTLLNPSGTAGDNLDSLFDETTGQVTEAGWEAWENAQDQWNERLLKVGSAFGDLGTLMNMPDAMNIIGNWGLSDEEVLQKLKDDLGLVPVEVEPEVEDGAAASIVEQVGTVNIPVKFVPVGEPIEGPAYLPRNVGQPWRPKANGIWDVPYDGYLTSLHKGERVMPAREIASRSFSSNLYVENMNMGGGMSADALAATIAARNRRMMAGYGS
jgi:hypothetical protein